MTALFKDREMPTGVAPCDACGLPIGAEEAASWSATGGVLTKACHRRDGCLPALVRRVLALEAAASGQERES